nr:sushi, von Willebrand factor type A, EGF and pentraxin domain-containing protein 1-like isoform X1 [Ciona intestinalis]|eukprot:XP_018667440.1 sushi, von Willebrand factor type A, EGF and pentraxin domain-containing protein 1-like isoform X1 [Ciona intestinalis]
MDKRTSNVATVAVFKLIFCLGLIEISFSIDDSINVPAEYEHCTCSWSEWMNSDTPNDDGSEIETFNEQRKNGYSFCKSPVDIQCYNLALGRTITKEDTAAGQCSVDFGYSCNFLCDDYKIRVACCYCPPPVIGPAFQIQSQTSGACLAVSPPSSVSLVSRSNCNDNEISQLWNWVSNNQIMNQHNNQCISVGNTAVSSPVLTEDCDASDTKQKWSYDKRTFTLSSSSMYLDSTTATITNLPSNSHWIAKVDEGTADMNIMQGQQCSNAPDDPNFGSVSCSFGSYQGSECHFSCDYGYRLPSQAIYPAICMRNGLFNASAPTCEKIICNPTLTSPANGKVECTNSNNQDSNCLYECDLGYKLNSSNQQSLCMENGHWDPYPPPTCQKITCLPDPITEGISNGRVNCSMKNSFASKCIYTCDTGYELIGPLVRLCQQSSAWNATKPICQKIMCPRLPALQNGNTVCTLGNSYLSSCRFSCHEGYTMVGSGSTTCNVDRTWGSSLPDCQRKTCNKLTAPDNGMLSCSDSSYYSSVCSFECVRGYEIDGDGQAALTCTDEGWNYGSPQCTRISCPNHKNLVPWNGAIHCNDTDFFASLCTFTCDTGYEVQGSLAVICGSSGWNDTASTCVKRTCPTLANPRNGKVVCMGNEFNSLCFYSCDEGFMKSHAGGPPIKCLSNGAWSGPPDTCRRIKCRKITKIRNGHVRCSDSNNYNSNCTFRCKDDFTLYGETVATCGINGWDIQTPTCSRAVCSTTPSKPINGQITCSGKSTVKCLFSCNQGFRLIGQNETHCLSNTETWSTTEAPLCQRIQCLEVAQRRSHGSVKCTDGRMFGSQCNYTCNRGYSLSGNSLTHCTADGTWDKRPPVCQRVFCPNLTGLNYGETQCTDGSYYGSRCRFSCSQGYELIGEVETNCNLNRTWSKQSPYCERITCFPRFSNPSNGRVSCSDNSNFGSRCNFHCEGGFRLNGALHTTCNADGWSVGEAPTCTKITCPIEANRLLHGTESCDRSNEYLSECQYNCIAGYELVGTQFQRTCNIDGEWSAPRPICQEIKCPVLRGIPHGDVVCKGSRGVGSECRYVCDPQYRIRGNSRVRCTDTKKWEPDVTPICELSPTIPSTTTAPPTTTTLSTTTTERTTTTTTTPPPTTTTTTPFSTLPPTTTYIPPFDVVGEATDPPEPVAPSVPAKGPLDGTNTEPPVAPSAGGIPIIPIAVSIVVVVLIIVGITLFIVWRRRSRKPKFKNGYLSNNIRYDNSDQLQKLVPNGSSNRRYPAIPIDRLESEFTRKHADDDKLFREEYSNIPEGVGSRDHGGKSHNKDKNRYTNVIPFDHSRVVLPKSTNTDGDYINASFVDGYKHKGKFIAAQGPKDGTINDFWRMIWDQNVTTIIMVTNLKENNENCNLLQPKCAQYWPQSGSSIYGDLSVVYLGENHLVDYTIRKFTIQQCKGEATLSVRRNMIQYHFTSWPDFGVPKSPSGILKFMRKIKHGSPTGYGAVVVHCSAGVGRTGTYICIDAMVDMMLREGKVDVYSFVTQMRNQRPEMVQTEQQYIFIYQALLEHHLYGDTEVEATEVNNHIDELSQRMPGNVTGMEHEFKKLTTIRIQKDQMRAGNHPANMRKNRVLLILPYDWNRAILPVRRGLENSDYINASYIDGYRQKDAYIATQGPLPHTIEDFWRLIWETKSASIVMLTELVERGQAKCEQYWPNEGTLVYGDLNVQLKIEEELDNYTTRDFIITNNTDHTERKQMVRQFHYHGWPETGPPSSGFSMISLVEQVQKQQQSSGNHPITIHCSAGAGRTGAFCALSTALEQVKAEGVLDMFQIVKCLRMQRPHMVQNLEQYEFCYRAVQEYIDSMSEYYNFK